MNDEVGDIWKVSYMSPDGLIYREHYFMLMKKILLSPVYKALDLQSGAVVEVLLRKTYESWWEKVS